MIFINSSGEGQGMSSGISTEKNGRKIVIRSDDKLHCARCCPFMRARDGEKTLDLVCLLGGGSGIKVGESFKEQKRTLECLKEFPA